MKSSWSTAKFSRGNRFKFPPFHSPYWKRLQGYRSLWRNTYVWQRTLVFYCWESTSLRSIHPEDNSGTGSGTAGTWPSRSGFHWKISQHVTTSLILEVFARLLHLFENSFVSHPLYWFVIAFSFSESYFPFKRVANPRKLYRYNLNRLFETKKK